MEVPRHFDVSLQFTPIHNFAPQLMDGTREYALFTPDQANALQKNRYLPPKTDNVFKDENDKVVRTDKKGNVIATNAQKANEVVDSLKTQVSQTSSKTQPISENFTLSSTISRTA
jgi:hypothetical protein